MADTNATIKYTPSKDVKLSDKENIINVEVTAQDKATRKEYEIKVIRSVSSSKEITSFGFDKPIKVTGIIDSAKKTISVTVPNKTDVTALVAIFTTTGKTVKVGSIEQKSGETKNDFSNDITYTVIAANDSTQDYVVKVTVAQDTSKELTSFGFDKPNATGVIDKEKKTVSVMVPYGTAVTELVAKFTTTGKTVKIGNTDQISGTTKNDFSKEVTYKVIAADGNSTEYKVTVNVSSPSKNANLSELTVSSGSLSPAFSENETSYKVNVANNVDKITVTGKQKDPNATISYNPSQEVKLDAGIEKNITVEVTAQDGTTKKKYEIKVTRAKSSVKEITAFGFESPKVDGTIDKDKKTIAVTVPFGTDLTKLVAKFTFEGASVKVGLTVQESGKTANNFTDKVTYTVFAENGEKLDYVVTVTKAKNPAKELLTFGFANPNAVGTIEKSAKTVSVPVPYGTNVTALAATFTIKGVSVRVGSEPQISGTTTKNFTNSVTYTVVAEDGSTQDYVVTVSIAPYVFTVTFEGEGATTGPVPATMKVKEPDKTVGNLPAEPKRTKHKFGGWFLGKNGTGSPFTGSTTVTQTMSVYAYWIPVCKVIYHANNGTGAVPEDRTEYENSKTVTVLDNNLTREYYSPNGWNTKEDMNGTKYLSGSTFTMGSVDVNLYAQWSMNAPEIKIPPVAKTLDPMDDVEFTVSATGADLHYQWQKDNTNIDGATSQTYKKSKIVFTDDGQYKCVVSNAGGNVTSTAAKLTVNRTLSDKDGNVYDLVIIGTQVWTVQNFRCTKYNDGTPIPNVEDGSAWKALTTPGYCYYNNSIVYEFQRQWGALYNWYAVNTGSLAPTGWRVPTKFDWYKLVSYTIANHNYDGTTDSDKAAKALAANTNDWKPSTVIGTPGNEPAKNNATGFSALPGGMRHGASTINNAFMALNAHGNWWTTSEYDDTLATHRNIYSNLVQIGKGEHYKKSGLSVRLVKD